MCLQIFIHIFFHAVAMYMKIWMYVCINIYINIYVYINIYLLYIYTYIYIYIYLYTYIYTFAYIHVYIYIYIHKNTYTHVYILHTRNNKSTQRTSLRTHSWSSLKHVTSGVSEVVEESNSAMRDTAEQHKTFVNLFWIKLYLISSDLSTQNCYFLVKYWKVVRSM